MAHKNIQWHIFYSIRHCQEILQRNSDNLVNMCTTCVKKFELSFTQHAYIQTHNFNVCKI